MARRVVLDLIDQFRARFQREGAVEVPLALRQEAPDVVFTGLLEEDKPVMPEGGPLLSGLGLAETPAELPPALDGGEGAGMTLDELIGLSGGPTEGPAPMADPLAGLEDPLAALQPTVSAPPQEF